MTICKQNSAKLSVNIFTTYNLVKLYTLFAVVEARKLKMTDKRK